MLNCDHNNVNILFKIYSSHIYLKLVEKGKELAYGDPVGSLKVKRFVRGAYKEGKR